MALGRQWHMAVDRSAGIECRKVSEQETLYAQQERVNKGLPAIGHPPLKLPEGIEPGM